MKYSEFHRLIKKKGWVIERQNGTSHVIYKKGNKTVSVPNHGSKELPKGLELKLKKEMNL
jgi:predicted RNA binding protein YcfA (HicA-like mRNA interferase family)